MLLHAAHRALVLSEWVWDPAISVPLAATAVWYGAGVRAARRRAPGRGVPAARIACFYAGWVVLALALVSPLHPLGEQLFSMHMVQHTLMMTVAAPLLMLGRPLLPFVWALPARWRRPVALAFTRRWPVRSAWRGLTHPFTAWAVHAAVLWLWHAPALYGAVLRSEGVHALQHVCFLAAALLFWWSVLPAPGARKQIGPAVASLFTTAVHSTVLGALIALAPAAWFAAYARTAPEWGLTALEDQQLAGLIMWVPAGLAYLAATLVLVARVLREPSRTPRFMAARAPAGVVGAGVLAVVALGAATACGPSRDETYAASLPDGGHPDRGRGLIRAYGCGSCHSVPGVTGADGLVGPPLGGIADRMYIAGVLTNEPKNMVRWIRDPKAVDSLTAMPNVGVSERDAQDIAAYLYTLRSHE